MNRRLALALPFLIAAPALAQDQGGGVPGGNWGGSQTRAETISRVGMVFNRLDTDHDGFVSTAEIDRVTKAMAEGGGDVAIGNRMTKMLAAADTDHDGKISLAEMQANAGRRFDLADTNHDGTLTREERQAARAASDQAPQQ
ncbi:MAG TPA: EF-hand domain-containing protein [Sphingomonas sp.]|nr:EF-hand domain-containing protein [Sphingomonas sp.]